MPLEEFAGCVTQTSDRRAASVEERVELGKAARAALPRSSHAALEPAAGRDPVGRIIGESADRVAELVPIRYGRMLASPFAFYRGTASLMAADLAGTPKSGLDVQLCGDAHLSNFGAFASPSRRLVFDLNDFDETLPGPFEWDVKRLAASFELLARHRGFSDAERSGLVLRSLSGYREAMRGFADMSDLSVWYAHADVTDLIMRLRAERAKAQAKAVQVAMEKAQAKDHTRAMIRLTEMSDGHRRIRSQPPLIVPVRELSDVNVADLADRMNGLISRYTATLSDDRRALVSRYRYVDAGRKVVGVGSVGTRCWIVLFLGRDDDDPLVLQVKEASESALEPYLEPSAYANHGERVVQGQRLMQAESDIFLGWLKNDLEGPESRDLYVRQLWDWKASLDPDTARPEGLLIYAQLCGWTLARAHARTGDRIAISAYLGKGDTFDRAVAEFSTAYADVAQQDFQAFERAAAEGRIATATG